MLSRGLLTPDRSWEFVRAACLRRGRGGAPLQDLDVVLVDRLDAWQRDLSVTGALAAAGPALRAEVRLLSLLANGGAPVLVLEGDAALGRVKEPCRLFVIRGQPTAAGVLFALRAAVQHLAPGGLVVLFDAFNEQRPHVNDALLTFLEGSPTYSAVVNGGRVTAISEAGVAPAYRARVTAMMEAAAAFPWALHSNEFMAVELLSIRPEDLRWRLDFWQRWARGRIRRVLRA